MRGVVLWSLKVNIEGGGMVAGSFEIKGPGVEYKRNIL